MNLAPAVNINKITRSNVLKKTQVFTGCLPNKTTIKLHKDRHYNWLYPLKPKRVQVIFKD
jgi:hypothetical protein